MRSPKVNVYLCLQYMAVAYSAQTGGIACRQEFPVRDAMHEVLVNTIST